MFSSLVQGHTLLLLHITALTSKVEKYWNFIEKPFYGISNPIFHSKKAQKVLHLSALIRPFVAKESTHYIKGHKNILEHLKEGKKPSDSLQQKYECYSWA